MHQETKNQKRLQRKTAKQIKDALKAKGCILCGYKRCMEALEFHHIVERNGCPGHIVSRLSGEKSILKEADKCVVLCSNCHKEVHAGLVQLD